ncbi:hypothetical protein DW322_19395 [Rhodococcus rhodnii]|uniref:Cardiolipin synthase N-terminal domain-containing protein n=2 Tax=Rhodococcus rhodnii TaxID=38312 RepID=R7WSQ0_9NOCA|nr:hypothetical protein [Rhodococcus rhodnii]EOM77169.1 hypothetical protein Rrhod_1417 [Rhodococcus rhodnii LMG 5362]TXG91949.1 hypothetical protein DW322_19395 [Rhodococcus rhodnii]
MAKNSERSTLVKSVLALLAIVQLALAFTAWRDLRSRPAEQIKGSKTMWAWIIGINFVGPLAYLRYGRRPGRDAVRSA